MPDDSTLDDRIYLSDVDPHASSPVEKIDDLRARVVLHVLFADTLLIGDSQSLNNKYFRSLLSAEEAERVRGERPFRDVAPLADPLPPAASAPLSDLTPLLDRGHIRVARRLGSTLRELRDVLAAKGVENAAEPGYAAFLDDLTREHAVDYDGVMVSAAFKAGVLLRVEAGAEARTGDARAVLGDLRAWAQEQRPLDYKALRDRLATVRAGFPEASADVVSALTQVDKWAGESYRHALPEVLDAGLASPRDLPDLLPQSRSHRVLRLSGLPSAMLDETLLARLPVDVLLEALDQPARTALVGELGALRRGLAPDTALLGDAAGEFAAWMSSAFTRLFAHSDDLAGARLRAERREMELHLHEDRESARFGAELSVRSTPEPMPAAEGSPNLSMTVVTGTDEEQPEQPARLPVSQLDPRERVMV
ncbi:MULTISPECIES: hypothetical protein [unclassified Embleya]|uniref:hypothetical protein n=1 Tax=unclassified Embleya TaxID=2699296 RepID=UPI00340CD3E4